MPSAEPPTNGRQQPYESKDSLYDPFRRTDRYGIMGKAPQPWTEYVRLLLLGITLVPIKAVLCFGSVLFCYICSRISALVPAGPREAFLEVTLKFGARGALLGLGFAAVNTVSVTDGDNDYVASNTQGKRKLARAQRKGREQRKSVAVGAIVSNHVGYADILVHMSKWLPSFVARDATANLPFIGICSIAMGCLFVDREKGDGGKQINKEYLGVAARVKERMQQVAAGKGPHRRPILLFPEGTTTNGRYLLGFRTGSFIAGVPVQPIILKYGESRVSPAWETIRGAWHIFLMLATPLHTVTVYELPVYMPSEAEQQDARLYADNVRQIMLKYSGLIPHDATFDDKRVFHAALRGETPPLIKKQQ